MRVGIQGRRLGAVQIGILFVRDHFSDLRCRDDFPAAVCGGVHGTAVWRVSGDAGVFAVAGGGAGLGVAEGRSDVAMKLEPAMDEGLRNELSKQGIFTTKLADIYNWAWLAAPLK